MPDVVSARARFPRGLVQPENGFRFSRDALLLAAFAAGLPLDSQARVADLGTGCGVIGLGLLLQRSDLRVVGLERDHGMADAARLNAVCLGLAECFSVVEGHVGDAATLAAARRMAGTAQSRAGKERTDKKWTDAAEMALPQFDAVICNPPWRKEGSGRMPPSPTRRAALFGDDTTFPLFFDAADALLTMGGALALICGADRLGDVLAALPERLRPVRLRFVHARPDAAATFFLLEARKGSGAALRVDAPLILEEER